MEVRSFPDFTSKTLVFHVASNTSKNYLNTHIQNTATMEPPLRERGTLKHTLPRRPIILIALVGIVSAVLAAQLMQYSIYANYESDARDDQMWWIYFSIACMGSIETIVGIILGDSVSQSLVMSSMVRLIPNCCL